MAKYRLFVSFPFMTPQLSDLFPAGKHIDGKFSVPYIEREANGLELDFSLLESDRADVILAPLDMLPLDLPEGLVIAALSPRISTFIGLVLHKKENGSADWHMGKGSRIMCYQHEQLAQLAQVFHDSHAEIKALNMDYHRQIDGFDAFLVPDTYYRNISEQLAPHRYLRPNASDLCPNAGYGVFALLCRHSDIDLRKALAKIHHAPTAELSNLERTALKAWKQEKPTPLMAHAWKDEYNYYHLIAETLMSDGRVLKARSSMSTKSGLAETVLGELKNKINN
jgi:metal-responsive CopG/Arc/MetJ family transcriptional regulator